MVKGAKRQFRKQKKKKKWEAHPEKPTYALPNKQTQVDPFQTLIQPKKKKKKFGKA